jgi:hypothetical protein
MMLVKTRADGPAAQRFYTATDAAKMTGFSYGLIRELMRLGEIPIAATVGNAVPLLDQHGIAKLTARKKYARRGRSARNQAR